ncbi:MAG: glycosyltransferase family 4 protein [Candidatus Cloacimonetes bacterium]|nr:glycosyltransferase family 4 protein [Candidatus Cloacimonadota bacterium]
MNILMLLEHHFPPDIRVEKEIKTLLANGYQITVACVSDKDETETNDNKNLTIIRKRIPKFVYKSSVGALKFPFYFNFWRAFVNSIIKQEQIDVLHVHDLPLAKIAWEIREKHSILFVLDLHENYPYMLQVSPHTKTIPGKLLSSFNQWLEYEKTMIKEADLVLSVIEEQKDRLVALGADPEKIYLVSNTPIIEKDMIHEETTLNKKRNVFLYAGNFYSARGLNILIPAFNAIALQVSDTQLWLVGNGKNLQKMKQYAHQFPTYDRIVFYGWQTYEKTLSLIAESDFTIIPHLRNGHSDNTIPNKLFQYMMLGKTVISSNCPPIERILTECQAGLTYNDKDIQELSDKMLYAIHHREEMRMMGQNGRKAVVEKYNWNFAAKNLIAGYQHLF